VDVMDKNSPSNSSTTTLSAPPETHKLGQLAAKLDDPKEATLKGICQETINFMDDGPPSLNCPSWKNFSTPNVALMFLGKFMHSSSPQPHQSF